MRYHDLVRRSESRESGKVYDAYDLREGADGGGGMKKKMVCSLPVLVFKLNK